MENQEYLNQISTKPAAPSKPSGISGILNSKIILVAVIGLVAFVILAIVGMLLSSGKGSIKEETIRLQLHIDSVVSMIDTYQPNVKSSDLRSNSASLKSVLTNTSNKISSYLTEKYNIKNNKDADKDLQEEIQTNQDALNAELFEAKITGNLDRVYAHKMAYEISKFITEEKAVLDGARDDVLKEAVIESYTSLENLYGRFNDFSETK